MTRAPMKAAPVVHRMAFLVAIIVYVTGCWMLVMHRPDIMQRIAHRPLDWRTIAFVGSVITIGGLLWPLTGLLARTTVGSRDIK